MIRKFIIAIALVLTAISAQAEFRWGPTASANFNTYIFKQKLVDVKMATGAQAGIMGELMFPGVGFGVDIGLQYSYHGAKINLGQKEVWAADGYGDENVMLHSLQIPVHLRFKYTRLNGVERTIAPFVFAGPRFSFHVGDNGVKAFEYPAGSVTVEFGIGAELMEKIQVFGTYNLGVSYELRTRKLDNFSARPSTWGVGVAWLF